MGDGCITRRSRLIYTRDFLLSGPLVSFSFIAPCFLFHFSINNDNSLFLFLWGVTPGKSIINTDFLVHTFCSEGTQNEKRFFCGVFSEQIGSSLFITEFFRWLLINAEHWLSKTRLHMLSSTKVLIKPFVTATREPETETSLDAVRIEIRTDVWKPAISSAKPNDIASKMIM